MTTLAQIEDDAATRYVTWDHALWTEVVDGPARTLSAGLLATGEDHDLARKTLESWLKLAAEAIGCGYLVPARAGAQTVLTRLWTAILPAGLPAIVPEKRPEVLAACWNLGENLETSPAWLRRIFLHELDALNDLGDMPGFVAGVGTRIWEPPARTLDGPRRVQLVDLARDDRRFLPGEVQFVSPRVVCVTDRLRAELSLGIWLVDPPILLGPMARPDPQPARIWPWQGLRDPRISRVHGEASNRGFAVATLQTSQHLVVVRPEAG